MTLGHWEPVPNQESENVVVELPPRNRHVLGPLFAQKPYVHGEIAAVLHGDYGRAFALLGGPDEMGGGKESAPAPVKAALLLAEHFAWLAGEHDDPRAVELIRLLNPGITVIPPDRGWRDLVTEHVSYEVSPTRREAFEDAPFDLGKLLHFTARLPKPFAVRRIEPTDVESWARDVSPFLTSGYCGADDFARRGLGFGVAQEEEGKPRRWVAGVSAAAPPADGKVEFEVQTHPDFRRRGFATAASAAMILYCRESKLEPCWDAANEESSALARSLGFMSICYYLAFHIDEKTD